MQKSYLLYLILSLLLVSLAGCAREEPPTLEINPSHIVSCHFAKEIKAGTHLPTEELGVSDQVEQTIAI